MTGRVCLGLGFIMFERHFLQDVYTSGLSARRMGDFGFHFGPS